MTNIVEKIFNNVGTLTPELVVINMVNGYEIIGEVHGVSNGFFHLEKSMLFSMRQTSDGKVYVDLVPPTTFAEGSRTGYDVSIAQNSIATIYYASNEAIASYKEKISAIMIASGMKL